MIIYQNDYTSYSSDLKKCKNSNFLKQYSYVQKRVYTNLSQIDDVYSFLKCI